MGSMKCGLGWEAAFYSPGCVSASSSASQDSACDTVHQQLPPVRAMGSEFAGVRYRNRFDGKEESPPWRLVGAVDGTKLTWEPTKPIGAPDTLSQGQVVELSSPGGWVVKSQDKNHPFYLSAHMTGWGTVSTAGGALLGAMLDGAFDGTVRPFAVGLLAFALGGTGFVVLARRAQAGAVAPVAPVTVGE